MSNCFNLLLFWLINMCIMESTELGTCGPTTYINALDQPQTLVSSDVTKDRAGPYRCSWVIRASNSSVVMRFHFTDIFLSPDSTCQSDYVVIREGKTDNGRVLRVWCKNSPFDDVIYTNSDSIYIRLVTYSNRAGLVFILSFWTSAMSQTVTGPVELGIANYFLIALSIVIVTILVIIVVYLYIREVKRTRMIKKETFKQKLRIRRQGISGVSGTGIDNAGFQPEDSSIDTETSFSFLTPSPDFSV